MLKIIITAIMALVFSSQLAIASSDDTMTVKVEKRSQAYTLGVYKKGAVTYDQTAEGLPVAVKLAGNIRYVAGDVLVIKPLKTSLFQLTRSGKPYKNVQHWGKVVGIKNVKFKRMKNVKDVIIKLEYLEILPTDKK